VPLIFNLRRDPYERSQKTSNTYYDWMIDRAYLLVPAQAYVGQFLADLPGVPAAPEGRQLLARRRQVMEKRPLSASGSRSST
jgi:hypothetical protein